VQAAGKKLPAAESRILGEFMRLLLVTGVNPSSAASTAHAHLKPLDPKDKAAAYGATYELAISAHNRVFYKFSGNIITLTNLVPVETPK
jgi:hypothetical protein